MKCIICNVNGIQWGKKPDYNKYTSDDPSGKTYGVRKWYYLEKCPNCDLFWVSNPDTDYEKLYSTNEYWTTYQKDKWSRPTLTERLEHDLKYSQDRTNEILKYKLFGKVTEIGCSSGTLLKCLKEKGFDPQGIELSTEVCKQAQDYSGCIVTKDINNIKTQSQDITIAIDVLEHVLNPIKEIQNWIRITKTNGLIFLELPDSSCESAINGGIDWDYIVPTEHIYYFKPEHVIKIFNGFGLHCINKTNPYTTDRQRLVFN